jgi:hypothetical protein
MSVQVPLERIKEPLLECLDETFSSNHGIFLDKGTTLFETLAGVSSEEASQAISKNSATIAAQVEHVRLYLDVLNDFIRTKQVAKINWKEIWETVGQVTPEEWDDLKRRLRESHARVLNIINSSDNWDGEYDIAGPLSILAHTAYHLGGIRQALGAIRAVNRAGQGAAG